MKTFRPRFLAQIQRCGPALAVLALTHGGALPAEGLKVEPPASDRVVHESKERPDIPDADSPKGLRVVQITTDPRWISHHMYPEAHMFTPDCRRFIFHRMPTDEQQPGAYWLCDIDDHFGLRKLIDERGAGGPSVSPDGQWAYYLVFDRANRALTLKRVSLKTFHRETLAKFDRIIPGSRSLSENVGGDLRSAVPAGSGDPRRGSSEMHSKYEWQTAGGLTSISSDGKRLCTMAELHTGSPENRRYGIVVIDLEKLSAHVAFDGNHEFLNMHLQYCRSLQPAFSRDILVQHNHGGVIDKEGRLVTLTAGAGADLHVIRDDGAHWRDVPLGRDGTTFCTGHQQWRGAMPSVISSMSVRGGVNRHRLYEATPIATDEATSHKGSEIPGAAQNDLTRNAPETNFSHFCIDASGLRLAARHDRCPGNPDVKVYIASFSPGQNAVLKVQYLLNTRWRDLVAGWHRGQSNKPRPILSPDASLVLFHTDRDGKSEIFLADHYTFP